MRALLIILFAACEAGAGQSVPVFYVANHGQAPPGIQFMAKGSGLTAYFLRREILLRAHDATVHMRFEGVSPSTRLEGAEPLSGRANFLTGAARHWRRDEPIFGAVRYRDLYPGIDMVYGANGRQLKSEFVVAPGADPARIRVRYAGAGKPTVEPGGALSIPLAGSRLGEGAPYIYQERSGLRTAIEGGYAVRGDGTVGFTLGIYDAARPLIIDPVLSFSMLLGGLGSDYATAIAVDATGSAYIAGYTASYNLPTANPEQNFNAGGNDVFIAKLNPTGSGLAYCTYVGGSYDDRAYGIAVDATGSAYVTGSTTSHNFPTRYPLQSMIDGWHSAFVLKLNPAGNVLVFSTYLGGNGADTANGIALDGAGNSYVVGDTTSMDFPATGFQTAYHGSQDAFVAKLSADGQRLLYSTYLGGSGTDHGAAIAVDANGSAYITGSTYSKDFPVANAFQEANSGSSYAFVARLSSDGNTLLFGTYLGGSGGGPQTGQGIALNAQGDVYVAGVTGSPDFPLLNAWQPKLLGSTDAFVAKFNSSGVPLYSTYMGGSGVEVANAIAVDPNGAAYIVGYTYSTDFPVTAGVQANIGGGCDAFLFKLSPMGDELLYATYLGGTGSDTASGVALDPSGNVYIAGWTFSPDFPVLKPGTP